MKFSASTSALLLAGSVAASPLAERAIARRNGATRNVASRPNARVQDTSESTNWSGGVLVSTGFTSVSASVVAPTPSLPEDSDDSTQYCGSAWVGIDGDTCSSAILQTGFDFCIQGTDVSYDAWYEWLPADAYDFSGITISAGDTIEMNVTATSKSSGTATVTNQSNGDSVTKTWTSSETEADLCEENAEWIVEDFTEISSDGEESLAPFPAFETITFTDAIAIKDGSTVTASDAETIDLINEEDEIITTASVDGDTVTVTYK
jgi:Peptidase A4 family